MIRTDLGIATAYAEAVSKGYTGTRDEFGQMFADFGKTAEKVTEDKKAVERMKTSVEETKSSVDTTAAEFGQNVVDMTAEATAAITEHANTEKESATAAISEAKDAATGAITEAQTSATDAIASAKDSATAEIAKKGTDTLATIPEDYTTLTKDVSSLKEDLSNKITKFYASNLGETHITDSDNGKIQDMMIYGKSEQFTTTGKNLLKIKDVTQQTTRGITVTAKDGVVALKGTATESGWAILDVDSFTLDGTYILSSNIAAIPITIVNKSYISVLTQNKSKTLKNEEMSKVCFSVTMGKTYDVSNILVQIEKGSEATSYEPYTGGKPSPSPDYPQEIKSVVNPVMKVLGKNLYDSQKYPVVDNRSVDTNTGNIYVSHSGYYCAVEKYIPFPYGGKRISYNNSMSLCAYDENYNFLSSIPTRKTVPDGTMYVRFDIKNIDKDKAKIELSETITDYESYKENSFSLPYTLNAIPVPSNGNITINEQQYIADYVDVERGKLVKMVDSSKLDNTQSIVNKTEWLLAEPQEIDLTQEEVQTLKAFVTYYPVTNISVNSEQLDGYTVFNYPVSMANGWNYVKQQLNDNRDYIYDMDTKTQDIDTQAAEAYVNSEYAVALTELEVM